MARIKKIQVSVTENVERVEPSYAAGGSEKWGSPLRNSLALPQNVSYYTTQQFHL